MARVQINVEDRGVKEVVLISRDKKGRAPAQGRVEVRVSNL